MSQAHWGRVIIAAGTVTLAGLFFGPSVVAAAEEPAGPNTGKISLSAGVDWTTAYFFRGINQEDAGFIAQPFGDVTFKLYDGGEGLNSVSAKVGIWNSFQSQSPGDEDDPKSWYEADLYAGLTFGFFDKWESSAIYTAYTSPNNSFDSVQEIAFGLSFDDSDLLGALALSPHILLAVEVQGAADGTDSGVYLELGIQPGLTLIESEDYPVTLSFPMKLGLSLDDYYQDPNTGDDDTFGYFDLGIMGSVPLAFIPASYGAWEMHAGVHFLFLGDSLEEFNRGDSFQAIGTIGISLAY
jgi:hypothetical protein